MEISRSVSSTLRWVFSGCESKLLCFQDLLSGLRKGLPDSVVEKGMHLLNRLVKLSRLSSDGFLKGVSLE